MKRITHGLLIMMSLAFFSVVGWAQTPSISASDDSRGAVNEIFSNFNQKVHTQIHALTNNCMRDVTKIPADIKVKWCQEQKQKKIDQMQRTIDQIGQRNPFFEQQLEQLQNDLDRCQYIAEETLIEQCEKFEKSINMQRLADPNL